ncbi:hypothetical protein LG311_01770 [Sutcliffiella horikoshii]|uniref:hypothetical protein n=1 Tax=Sutcliffiella horikoshii TaxID=79883 RepID=UPI00384D4959
MNLLKKIDNNYASIIDNENKDNSFFYYLPVKIETFGDDYRLVFLKHKMRTKFIFRDKYNRSLYLTDADIIEAITGFNDNIFEYISEALIHLYKEEYHQELTFNYDNEDYNFVTLQLNDSQIEELKEYSINTKADFCIRAYDLVILIGLILFKERMYDEITKAKDTNFRYRKQLSKFISLSKFYKNGEFKEFLHEVGYDISEKDIHQVYNSSKKQYNIDKAFNKLTEFEKYI